MPNSPPDPRPSLPRRLLDDAWWLAEQLAERPARVIAFPSRGARAAPAPSRSGGVQR